MSALQGVENAGLVDNVGREALGKWEGFCDFLEAGGDVCGELSVGGFGARWVDF